MLLKYSTIPAGLLARLLYGLGVLVLCLALLAPESRAESVRVQQVLDGDTLRLDDGRSLRLAGIDTPELGHGKAKDQYYARAAKEKLQALVGKGMLTLRTVSKSKDDRHKRLLAEALLDDGTSVNEAMVADGAALAYWHKDLHPQFWNKMLKAQQQALRDSKGMWKHVREHRVNQASYTGNRNSMRLFPVDCPTADKISPRNKQNFSSLEKALHEGFSPARICLFWPEE